MTNTIRLKRSTYKVTWALLAVWLAWEVYLLASCLWSFFGPQRGAVNGVIYHGHTDRIETEFVAMLSGYPLGLYVPALIVDPVAKKLGVRLFGTHDTVVDFIFSWLIICASGYAQWYLVLRGLGLAIGKLKRR
jgi:hypothetical protein